LLQLVNVDLFVEVFQQTNQMSYIKPDDCNSPRAHWTLLTVLEDRGPENTSLAVGRWDGTPCLAIRWNGSDENPLGNPQSRGIPTWFILPDDYADNILRLLPLPKQNLARQFLPEPEQGE
jgi:hypothetical protein